MNVEEVIKVLLVEIKKIRFEALKKNAEDELQTIKNINEDA